MLELAKKGSLRRPRFTRTTWVALCFSAFVAVIIGCGGGGSGRQDGRTGTTSSTSGETTSTTSTTSGASAGSSSGTDSGGGGTTNQPTSVSISVNWPTRSRQVNAPSSALSAVVTVSGASQSGNDVTFSFDRGSSLAAFTQTYTSPATVMPGTWPVNVTFYTASGGSGTAVAVGSSQETVPSSGGGTIESVTLTNTIQKVTIGANQIVPIGGTFQLVATPTDANGNVVAVTPGSFVWSAGSSSNVSVTADGIATGTMVGPTSVTANVDGASASGSIYVSATGSTTAPLYSLGSQVQDWYSQFYPSGYEPVVAAMASIGFTTMRVDAHWDDLEAGSTGQFNTAALSRYQGIVAIDKKYGMSTIFVLDTTTDSRPTTEWGSTPDGTGGFPITTADITAFNTVFTQFLQSLPGSISVDGNTVSIGTGDFAMELGNEPNLFCTTSAQAQQYGQFAAQFRQSISTAGVSSKLVGPAVTTWQDGDGLHLASTDFITDCGVLPFDILSFHAYCGTAPPSYLAGTISSIVSLYQKNSTSKPIWATESGYSTSTDGNGVSTAIQATYDVQMAKQLLGAGISYVGVYKAKDSDSPNDPEPDASFGVTDSGLNWKPSATAINAYLVPPTASVKRFRRLKTRAVSRSSRAARP